MVYDGTQSGLNAALWAPWFFLPGTGSMIRTILPGYYCGDNDFGEMFLNYWLHQELMPYVGVDVTETFPDELERRGLSELLVVWTRCAMGLTPSPCFATQFSLRAKSCRACFCRLFEEFDLTEIRNSTSRSNSAEILKILLMLKF